MKANELLLWLSARREGSWQQFRAAVEELHFTDSDSDLNNVATTGDDKVRLHQRLRLNLELLADVEFFARDCEEGWRVAPPTLAVNPVSIGFRAVLCGARSPALCERVLRAAQKFDCKCEALVFDGVPDVIRMVAADIAAIKKVADDTGVYFQPNASLSILSHTWPCDPPSSRREQSVFPDGAAWRIRQFDTLKFGWQMTDREQAKTALTGLFEFQLFDRWLYFLRDAGRTFKMPRGVALYALLRYHQGLLGYDAQACTLSLPGSCRPPRLLERALVLCSGFPPAFEPVTVRLTYADVPPDIARFAAELLHQPLP